MLKRVNIGHEALSCQTLRHSQRVSAVVTRAGKMAVGRESGNRAMISSVTPAAIRLMSSDEDVPRSIVRRSIALISSLVNIFISSLQREEVEIGKYRQIMTYKITKMEVRAALPTVKIFI